MKSLILFLMVLAVPLMGQRAQYWGHNDGRDFVWNKATKFSSDSTRFIGSDVTLLDTVGTDSIFYTQLIITTGDWYEGIANIVFSVDSISGANAVYDSVDLYVRRYFDDHTYPWETTWHQLVALGDCGVKYENQIADSTAWWKPANGIQFKLVFQDSNFDTVGLPILAPYIR